MAGKNSTPLRFNLGFLLEAGLGTSRRIEVDIPKVRLEELLLQPVSGVFNASRTSKGIYIRGKLHSFLPTECARCLDTFQMPVKIELDDLFYFRGTAPDEEYEIGDDGMMDLGPLVREMSLLDVPLKPSCKPDCRGLCSQCGHNRNHGECDCQAEEVDPRLAVLKNLLDN